MKTPFYRHCRFRPSGVADPSLGGKANFGLVPNYQKGATVPTGNTEFQFHAGGLNFNSSVYEWLTISGPVAQFKGSGTINGGGDYGFLLRAVDGQVTGGGGVDKFRIKISDKSLPSGSNTVYDNQTNATDDAAATTAIEGGSILIQAAKATETEVYTTSVSKDQDVMLLLSTWAEADGRGSFSSFLHAEAKMYSNTRRKAMRFMGTVGFDFGMQI